MEGSQGAGVVRPVRGTRWSGAIAAGDGVRFPLARRWAGTDIPLRWGEKIPYHLFDPLSMSADGMFSFLFPYTGQNYAPYLGICACGLALLGAALAWREQAVRVVSMIGVGGLIK